jgi:hypothetical protein
MEVLARQAENRLVLVVDHGVETNAMFANFIDVEFKNGVSTVMGGSDAT